MARRLKTASQSGLSDASACSIRLFTQAFKLGFALARGSDLLRFKRMVMVSVVPLE